MMQTMTWGDGCPCPIDARGDGERCAGELVRARFGGEIEPVVDWLVGLPAPVYAVYEAGPRDQLPHLGRPGALTQPVRRVAPPRSGRTRSHASVRDPSSALGELHIQRSRPWEAETTLP